MESKRWQRIRELYQQALELEESPRAEFLEHSCGNDPSLRREVESLLAQEKKAEKFIEIPAMEVVGKLIVRHSPPSGKSTADLQGLTISHYRVLEKLGGGGMGIVYKAEDRRLHRFVALKFLPGNLARDPQWLSRFRREAQAASALNHPNISTIYDIGEDGGNAFIAMEFLKGETLKQVIARAPLRIGEILDISVQMAEALEAAHGSGIVHRDVKPANVFICEGGRAKLLDFGVAKITPEFSSGGRPAADSIALQQDLTDTGIAVGTAAYMSPEQVRGDKLDGRTDLFSFGVVLYEMTTAAQPFKGNTLGAVSAAILHDNPRSPLLVNPRLSPALAEVITRALEKDRDQRYQHAADLLRDLRWVKHDLDSGKEASAGSKLRAMSMLFATRRHGAGSALARIAAVTLLVAAMVGGAIYYRSHHTRLTLSQHDTVVLADFNNQTGDPVFGDALKQAFAVELGQSPFLNVLSDHKVNETLRMMGRTPGDRISVDVGREICQRNGAKALLSGAISSLGNVYLITLSAVTCSTGENLAQEQADATSKENVLKALSQASSRLRSKLGESLPSVQKYESPVEATTSSLEALQNYSRGIRLRGTKGFAASLPFLQRAVELDPGFPSAYIALAVAYSNLGQRELALKYATKAYELRDRVTERERLRISTSYFRTTGETEKSLLAYEEWISSYPRDPVPHLNLGVTFADIGQHEKALSEIKQSLEIAPDFLVYSNLGFTYLCLNRLDEAQASLDQGRARGQDNQDLHEQMYTLAFLRGDQTGMRAQLAWATGRPGDEDGLLSTQSDTEAYYGRFSKAREYSRKAVDSALRAGSKETAAIWQVNAALREAEIGEITAARKGVAAALALSQGKDVKTVVALVLARIGDPKAETLAHELVKDYPNDSLLKLYWLPTIEASLELGRGNSAQALSQLENAESYELGIAGGSINYLYPAYVRGQAFLLAHNGRAAAGEFQKLMDHPGLMMNFVTGSISHLQIGRAYESAGESAMAKAAYQEFFNLWKDADPDIPLLKHAKLEYSRLQ
jgi:eukaryotic-like serine/threonine-protein kinase